MNWVKKGLVLVMAGAAFLGQPHQAAAWGADGHRAVAYIAYQLLTPQARQQVDTLLDDDSGQTFVAVSTWPDEIRRPQHDQPYPGSGPWHYVSIPLPQTAYDQARDCSDGNCVVEKIGSFNAVLSDPSVLPTLRADALKFVIHFVGDIHQPLHACENDDRGGNEVEVVLDGRKSNLHSVWDSGIIKSTWGDPDSHRQLLAQRARSQQAILAVGTAADWATESHKLARDVVYPSLGSGSTPMPGPVRPPVILSADYAVSQAPTVDTQIVKAGIRLAALLNADFVRR